VVAIFCRRLLAGEPVSINARRESGDAGCVRDYVYVQDVVRANLAALEGRLDCDVLNVGTGVPTSTSELAHAIATVGDLKLDARANVRRPGDLERSVLDPSAFLERLGPLTSLDVGLRATVEWFAHA
jgi:UDP-glucose 4-epimerase